MNSKRLKRSKSHVLMSDVIKQQNNYKSHAPDRPIHDNVESYFSTASGFTNFRGLLNLMIILLVVSNFRVALENVLKYGILIRPFLITELIMNDPYHWPCVTLLLISNVFILTIFAVECMLEKDYFSVVAGIVIQCITLLSSLIYSGYIVLLYHPSPIFSAPILGVYCVIFLKLWSYCHVNKWCREERNQLINNGIRIMNSDVSKRFARAKSLYTGSSKRSPRFRLSSADEKHQGDTRSNQSQVDLLSTEEFSKAHISDSENDEIFPNGTASFQIYPDNLNFGDLYYFMFAPTLCYELNFPRTLKIRKRFLLKRVLELIFLSQMMLGLIQQWIIPLLKNSVTPFSQSDILIIVERLLKLSIPNHLIWLMGFYVLFHSFLNVTGELMYFGDRLFYKDWWNAHTVTEFWSTWNIPVHRWARRHIFKPLLVRNHSKLSASLIVFVFSAFFHEFLVSVPLRMFRIWSFSAMIGQVPLAIFVSYLVHRPKQKPDENNEQPDTSERSQIGNFLVWISLIIGQPLAMMMYFHDYYVAHM